MTEPREDDTNRWSEVDVVYPAVSVGVRELKHETAAVLSRVEEGEAVMITNRGKAVAVLRPLNDQERRFEELVEKGVILPPESGGSGTGREIIEFIRKNRPKGPKWSSEKIDAILDYVRADQDLP